MPFPCEPANLREAVRLHAASRFVVALTGAGISVACGIPDFRSVGGVWSRFDPAEYATIEAFLCNPDKAWVFFRALGELLQDANPGKAHQALASMERGSRFGGIITQNIDGLHQAAGSERVLEVHGSYKSLECLRCRHVESADSQDLSWTDFPVCPRCGFALKPTVVLYGESIRCWEAVDTLIEECDLFLVIGTSASVFPIAGLPDRVKARGGHVIEFNLAETRISGGSDLVIRGDTETTIPLFVETALASI